MEIITVHLTILCITALAILFSDHQAFLYISGRKPVLDARLMDSLHYAVWAGLLGMIATGIIMILPAWEAYLSIPGFLVKMGFVGLLIGNSFVISSLKSVAFTTPFKDLSPRQKTHLFVSGAASTIGWIGAATTALIIFG